MTTLQPLPAHIIPPGSSPLISAFGDTMHLHLAGKDTADSFTLFTLETPPGNGPPPHVHYREDETFYVIEGSPEFFLDGKWSPASPGSVVFMPRNVPHTFRNAGSSTLKMLIKTSPAGFENFFAQCAEVFANGGPPDMAKLIAISESHGIHLFL